MCRNGVICANKNGKFRSGSFSICVIRKLHFTVQLITKSFVLAQHVHVNAVAVTGSIMTIISFFPCGYLWTEVQNSRTSKTKIYFFYI